MIYRPGTVKRIVPVTLSRPRDPSSPEFNAIKRELAQLVLEEQARYEATEARTGPVPDLTDTESGKAK